MAGNQYKELIEVRSYAQTPNSSGGFTAGALTTKYSIIASIFERDLRVYKADGSTSFSSSFSIEFIRDPAVDVEVGDLIVYGTTELLINQCRLNDKKNRYLIKATAKT